MGEWEISELIKNNSLLINDGYRAKNDELSNNGIPFARAANINNGFHFTNADCLPIEDLEKVGIKVSLPGDVVFTSKGTVGRFAFVRPETPRFVYSPQLCFWRSLNPDLIDSRWLYYWMCSREFYKQYIAVSDQTDMAAYVNLRDQRKMHIVLPPLPEQKTIASVLSSLDDKIDLLQRQNKTLEALAETLFRQWFVEEAEEDWEEGVLPEEFDFTMGLSPSGSTYNEDGIGIPLFQGNADFEFRFPRNRVYTTDPNRFAEKFDTLISVRAPVGAQNMAKEKCCIGRGVAAFRYKLNNSFYTYTYFKLGSLMREIQQFNETGTVFGSISKADFQAFEVIIPPLNLVEKYQNAVKPIDDKIIENCFQISSLEKLRDNLLPKLMSGEVRVEYENN